MYNKDMVIGYYNGEPVLTNRNAAMNQHIALIGASGSGKTVEAQRLVCEAAMSGETVLVISQHSTFSDDQLLPYYRSIIDAYRSDIYAAVDGITCPLFDSMEFLDGTIESPTDTASAISGILSTTFNFGVVQAQTLNCAVEKVFCEGTYQKEGIRALDTALKELGTKEAEKVRFYLKGFFSSNILREGIFLEEGKINIVHLDHLAPDTQDMILEVLVAYIWRLANAESFKNDPVYVFLDEIQNMSPKGVLPRMISEGRKFGVNLILATQMILQGTTNAVQQRISQCGLMMYFKPAANRINMTAKMINPNSEAAWVRKLRALKTGEFIACGEFIYSDQKIDLPLVITADTAQIAEFPHERIYVERMQNVYDNAYNE